MRKTPRKQQKILLKTGASNHRCKKYEPASQNQTMQKAIWQNNIIEHNLSKPSIICTINPSFYT